MPAEYSENSDKPDTAVLQKKTATLLCRLIRGETISWPPEDNAEFYRIFLEQAKQEGVDALLCRLLKSSPAWNSLPGSVGDSYFALIIDDLRCLPGIQSRLSLLRELVLPGREELLHKYGGEDLSGKKRASSPLLLYMPYLRYIVQGLALCAQGRRQRYRATFAQLINHLEELLCFVNPQLLTDSMTVPRSGSVNPCSE